MTLDNCKANNAASSFSIIDNDVSMLTGRIMIEQCRRRKDQAWKSYFKYPNEGGKHREVLPTDITAILPTVGPDNQFLVIWLYLSKKSLLDSVW